MNFTSLKSVAVSGQLVSPIEDILQDIRDGRMVIMVDSADRENEGDLVVSASAADHRAINFMARYGRGLICMAINANRAKRFGLEPMVSDNTDPRKTAFTVSVDAKRGISTGISAADRAKTISVLCSRDVGSGDIVSPGHLFPLVARPGGVLERAGHTEAAVDLSSLSGRIDAGVICEIMRDDGEMARLSDLAEFGTRHGLRIGTIADLIEYRMQRELGPSLLDFGYQRRALLTGDAA